MKVILLSPDAADRELACDVLTRDSHEVVAVETAADLYAVQQSVRQSIVVVAAEVVHREGLRLAQHLASRGSEAAILALAGEGDAERFRDWWRRESTTLSFRSARRRALRAAIAEHCRQACPRKRSVARCPQVPPSTGDRPPRMVLASPTVTAIPAGPPTRWSASGCSVPLADDTTGP